MEIRKLKRRLLREERKRSRGRSRARLAAFFLLFALPLAAGAYYFATSEQRLAALFDKGEALVAAGELEGALALFGNIYRRHPDFHLSPKAMLRSGDVLHIYLRRYREAILAYLTVERDYPESEEARKAAYRTAVIYKERLHDYGRALVAYQRLLGGDAPADDRIVYEVADCYFRLDNFEQARIEFEGLIKRFPESRLVAEASYRIAVAHFLEGAPDAAEKAFRAVIDGWPESPYAVEARFGLATALEERDKLRAALKILESLEGLYPNSEALVEKTAQVQERMRRKKRAI